MKPIHRLIGALLAGAALATVASAAPQIKPIVDTTPLPPVSTGWAELNPYRGNPEAIRIGQSAFNQSCAVCHGTDADGSRAPAPDLRRIGKACARVRDPALHNRCLSDADHWFVQSVLHGKKKFDIEHMPAWKGWLDPAVIWSLRSFVETAGRR